MLIEDNPQHTGNDGPGQSNKRQIQLSNSRKGIASPRLNDQKRQNNDPDRYYKRCRNFTITHFHISTSTRGTGILPVILNRHIILTLGNSLGNLNPVHC